ncbi:MAG: sigma-54 dependent transcriptional regulator [Flavobacteriaceae bacterium]|nr:sigma-54 dependent transcriptional regulator [Flavobacteriaceae bacterium]MCY4215749.1 sigma-54 dependent transcriptional regulator [Flavobacteriaceae bacterium]MCY4254017.1 sigma-54 dependent transcriptional regulator [Flavobacteriaceae bacterium]
MNIPIQNIKQRFEIIGNDPRLITAIETAYKIANSDISALIIGESGVGKESIPKIIHQYSHRKHANYFALNCGSIPEGTIDSELFGHEKGAFTGATQARAGHFEQTDKGTIFLDEVAELPLSTQVRLLRVLESGEFIRVGSSKVQKTDVRIIAATNVDIQKALDSKKFREDLYYRLCSVQIFLPPLRERGDDILLLFRKFASEFGTKYRRPNIQLDENAKKVALNYRWKGNIRQLRNAVEQLSVLEINPLISEQALRSCFPDMGSRLPMVLSKSSAEDQVLEDREVLYKLLFDMKRELNDLRGLVLEILNQKDSSIKLEAKESIVKRLFGKESNEKRELAEPEKMPYPTEREIESIEPDQNDYRFVEELEDQPVSLQEKEIEMIKSALTRSKGKRRLAAKELGISERTLYRKIKSYNLSKDELVD